MVCCLRWGPAVVSLTLLFAQGCNDSAEIYDFDGDGSLDSEDCAPADAEVYPGQSVDCVDADGTDANCDGTDGIDTDQDGYARPGEDEDCPGGGDCNDSDPSVHPGATEVPDNDVDEDCDGVVLVCDADDDGVLALACDGTDCDDLSPFCAAVCDDLDGDGFRVCDGDCDDLDSVFNPEAEEVCDGLDTNCDSLLPVDEVDGDGDGSIGCLDCNDSSAAVFPGAPEICDSADSDCDGSVGTGLGGEPDELDGDSDGVTVCAGDCDDADDTTYPGQWEPPSDGVDSDCDGTDATGLGWAPISFLGEGVGDESGWSVSSAGDVDGDGLGDLLVAAPSNGRGGALSGTAYLVWGSSLADGGPIELSEADAFFVGEELWDQSANAVAPAGDVDGDGLADILIGAFRFGWGNPGKSYLFFGSTLSMGGDFNLGNADVTVAGVVTMGNSGFSVSTAGDVDGDGLDDVLIGTPGGPGSTALFLGSTLSVGGSFATSAADATFVGVAGSNDNCGHSVAAAGDVNGDGLDDILIGAPYVGGMSEAGATYLFFGSEEFDGETYGLDSADATFGGGQGMGHSGFSVAGVGDLDGDARSDLLIGAPHSSIGADYLAGKSYLFLGSTASLGGVFDVDDDADVVFEGEGGEDQSGLVVASAGDVDGDGLGDLLISGPNNSDAGSEGGKTYLLLGSSVAASASSGWGVTVPLSAADHAFVGESEEDQSGVSVSSAGDVNDDGKGDLLVGAFGNDEAGDGAGKAYLLLSPY